MVNETELDAVRARAAARARSVRLGDESFLKDPHLADVERDYILWLTRYYPKAVSKPMAVFHRELWNWVWLIEQDKPHPEYDAFFGIWSRRGGKTTSGQLAVAALGARKKRRYGWLLSRTQAQANQKLLTIRSAISRMGSDFLRDYPHMAKAKTEDGQNLGWNTTRLICSDGSSDDFIVESIGLDMAVRGANIEFQRPDFIMPDDIDNLHDSHHVVEKNIETFTKSILLAGTDSKVVLGLQNLIHRDSIFAQIEDGRAKFLRNRFVSFYPALLGEFSYEERETSKGLRYFITSGIPTWAEGFGIETCEKELNDSGPDAFETECQHNVRKVREDATFREFDPVFHCVTVSEFMRFFVGRRAWTHDLQPLDVPFDNGGLAARLVLPRGDAAMAQDWGNNIRHPVGLRWLWRPGEGVSLSDSVFFIREQCHPTFPVIRDDPRATPSYRQVLEAILKVEKELGLLSRWSDDAPSIQFRLNSHERPEAAVAYQRDYSDLGSYHFQQIDTREAAEGILHLQELQHIDRNQFHPFRIDPRTIKDVPIHPCSICGWEHDGQHLQGRPRVYYLVADGQGELEVDKFGKLGAKPAVDELGQARTRFEYPRHKPRETSDGEEKSAAKKDDDIIDADKALAGRVFYMIKALSDRERLDLKYRKIYERVAAESVPETKVRWLDG